jgi:hypothetical protein
LQIQPQNRGYQRFTEVYRGLQRFTEGYRGYRGYRGITEVPSTSHNMTSRTTHITINENSATLAKNKIYMSVFDENIVDRYMHPTLV